MGFNLELEVLKVVPHPNFCAGNRISSYISSHYHHKKGKLEILRVELSGALCIAEKLSHCVIL